MSPFRNWRWADPEREPGTYRPGGDGVPQVLAPVTAVTKAQDRPDAWRNGPGCADETGEHDFMGF